MKRFLCKKQSHELKWFPCYDDHLTLGHWSGTTLTRACSLRPMLWLIIIRHIIIIVIIIRHNINTGMFLASLSLAELLLLVVYIPLEVLLFHLSKLLLVVLSITVICLLWIFTFTFPFLSYLFHCCLNFIILSSPPFCLHFSFSLSLSLFLLFLSLFLLSSLYFTPFLRIRH